MTSLIRFSIVLALIIGLCYAKHDCIHDQITSTFHPVVNNKPVEHGSQRILQTSSSTPIKIVFDDSNMKIASMGELDWIMKGWVPVAKEFFAKRLKVLSLPQPMRLTNSKCYNVSLYIYI